MCKRKLFLLPLLIFLISESMPVSSFADTVAYFAYSTDKASACDEDLVKLQVCANETEITAAGFRVRISYDQAVLTYIGTETSSAIKSGTMDTNGSGNPIYSVYVCNTDKKSAPKLRGKIIYYIFQVKKGAAVGKTDISAQIDQICDYDGSQLNADCEKSLSVDIVSALSNKAYLTGLKPSRGNLTPAFSPDIYEYTINVDYNVSSIEFQADAADGGTAKVNRKSLYKAGSDTLIIVTATSADKHEKTKYLITVTRDIKPITPKQSEVSSANSRKSPPSSGSGRSSALYAQESAQTPTAKSSRQSPKAGINSAESTLCAESEQAGLTQSSPSPEPTPESTPQTVAAASAGNIYFIEDRMPAYMVGMLSTAICIMTGVILNLWLSPKPK